LDANPNPNSNLNSNTNPNSNSNSNTNPNSNPNPNPMLRFGQMTLRTSELFPSHSCVTYNSVHMDHKLLIAVASATLLKRLRTGDKP